MINSEIKSMMEPYLDGRDEVYFIALLNDGSVKFLNKQNELLLSKIKEHSSAIYRFNYWTIDAKMINQNFELINSTTEEYKPIECIHNAYLSYRHKIVVNNWLFDNGTSR